ncbi:MAG: guanylate kinase [Ignavibacterium sp.]|nr:guanylate kinase [Ignavibacteria bacterium]MDH7527309.1 guanylate kinase [Ignavibacteria bacterium]NPV12006.1 guanylate kinase [Ignavibacteria bacterium]GIV45336.1 MAG: guanylate kinase [Ignavibacterium sp.]
MSKQPKLIVISAPSGTGKTSVIKEILKLNQDKLIFSVSATTRPKRANEIDGVDYYFLTEDEFKKKIENDEFIEWERIYDYYYGTLKSEIERARKLGKNILFELDVNGSLKLKKLYPNAHLIFIVPPSIEELENRLRKRNTETPETLKKRIERAKMELEKAKYFDYEVKNYELENAIEEVNEIIQKIIKE